MMHRCGTISGKWLGAALIAVLSVGLAWTSAVAADKVTYRLKWLINMSTVGDVYAVDRGFFAEQDLEVDVKAGGPERDPIRELELGYTDFGVASADQVIRAMDKGASLVVLAQLFQVNPLQWIYRSGKMTLEKPADLAGKSIGVTFGKNDEFIMRTLLARAGLEEQDVRLYGVRLDYTPFYTGKVDLWPVYINTQGVEIGSRMRKAGEQVAFFKPDSHGVKFVANSVITSRDIFEKRTLVVKRFVSGLLKGWRQAMAPENAERAIAVVQNYDRDSSKPVLQAQLSATRSVVQPPGAAIGAIDHGAWRQTEQIMLDYHQIEKPVNVVEILTSAAMQ